MEPDLDVSGDMEDDWEIDDWAGERSEEEVANFFGMTSEQMDQIRLAHNIQDEEEVKLQARLGWEMKAHGRPSERTLDRIAKKQGLDRTRKPEMEELLEKFGDKGQGDKFNGIQVNETWWVNVSSFGGSASEILHLMRTETEETPEVMQEWWKGGNVFSAGVILGRWLAMEPRPTPIEGKTVIELGCGLGFPGIVAAHLGAKHVLLTDYFERGLQEAMKSAVHESVSDITTGLRSNWTDLPDRLFNAEEDNLKVFQTPDLIIGSDILFEKVEAAQIAETLSKLLRTPDQVAQILDPYRRRHKKHFVKECESRGLVVKQVEVCTWEPDHHQLEMDENWFCELFTVRRAA